LAKFFSIGKTYIFFDKFFSIGKTYIFSWQIKFSFAKPYIFSWLFFSGKPYIYYWLDLFFWQNLYIFLVKIFNFGKIYMSFGLKFSLLAKPISLG